MNTLATNNGNLLAVTAYTPNDGATPAAFAALTGIPQSFTYDGLNRITSIQDYGTGAALERDFSFDPYGNMWLTRNDTGLPLSTNPVPPNTLSPSAPNPYTSNTNQLTAAAGAQYDLAGNQTTVGTYTQTYDAENRQVSSTTSGGTVTNYIYDGLGHRVEKINTTANTQTIYVYDVAGELAAEYSTTAPDTSCQTCFLSYDHLGSARMVTNESGQVVERHDYLPFGEEIIAGYSGRGRLWGLTTGVVDQKFTGKERDSESGLDYFGARYYGSGLGRFSSPDEPFMDQLQRNPQSWNLYAYVRNNPLNSVDPFGTCSQDSDGGLWDADDKGKLIQKGACANGGPSTTNVTAKARRPTQMTTERPRWLLASHVSCMDRQVIALLAVCGLIRARLPSARDPSTQTIFRKSSIAWQ